MPHRPLQSLQSPLYRRRRIAQRRRSEGRRGGPRDESINEGASRMHELTGALEERHQDHEGVGSQQQNH